MTNISPDDWRLPGASHLKGLTLIRKPWQGLPHWDHDHCAGCGEKLKAGSEGYASGPDYELGENYEWVCLDCFEELKDTLGWKAVEPSDPS